MADYEPELDQFAPMVQRLVWSPFYLYWGVEEGESESRWSVAYYLHLDEPWIRGRAIRRRGRDGRLHHLGLARRIRSPFREIPVTAAEVKKWG